VEEVYTCTHTDMHVRTHTQTQTCMHTHTHLPHPPLCLQQTPSNQAAIALEQEKVLPGVMVSELHDIFLTLEQLANIGDTG